MEAFDTDDASEYVQAVSRTPAFRKSVEVKVRDEIVRRVTHRLQSTGTQSERLSDPAVVEEQVIEDVLKCISSGDTGHILARAVAMADVPQKGLGRIGGLNARVDSVMKTGSAASRELVTEAVAQQVRALETEIEKVRDIDSSITSNPFTLTMVQRGGQELRNGQIRPFHFNSVVYAIFADSRNEVRGTPPPNNAHQPNIARQIIPDFSWRRLGINE